MQPICEICYVVEFIISFSQVTFGLLSPGQIQQRSEHRGIDACLGQVGWFRDWGACC